MPFCTICHETVAGKISRLGQVRLFLESQMQHPHILSVKPLQHPLERCTVSGNCAAPPDAKAKNRKILQSFGNSAAPRADVQKSGNFCSTIPYARLSWKCSTPPRWGHLTYRDPCNGPKSDDFLPLVYGGAAQVPGFPEIPRFLRRLHEPMHRKRPI